jgi:hypothetical protein
VVQGGHTQRHGARGVVESVEERLEQTVHSGLAAAGVEQGGVAVRGRGVVGAGAGRVAEVQRHTVELEEVTVGQGGGRWRRRSVDRGAAVNVGTTRGENRGGACVEDRGQKGELIGGALCL